MRLATFLLCAGLAGAAFAGAADDPPSRQAPPPTPAQAPGPAASLAAMMGLTEADTAAFASRFEREIWPLLKRTNGAQKSCVGCHDDGEGNKSALLLLGDPKEDFAALLADGYLDAGNPVALLPKVTHAQPKHRMPPAPGAAWSDEEVNLLRSFVTDLNGKRGRAAVQPDEAFPPSLIAPFDGPRPKEGPGNSFLSYWQLKGKIKTVFDDDWRRNERDLFLDNLAQFGGADFVRRFDESTKAAPSYFSALDALSRDVASKAFLNGTGPFQGITTELPEPAPGDALTPAYRASITRLFRAVLYREPSEAELSGAFEFIKSLAARRDSLAGEDYELAFELVLEDEAGLRTTQAFSIPVTNDRRGLYQQRVDESQGEGDGESKLLRTTLAGTFHFDPADPTQTLHVTNTDTNGNVSVHGFALRRLDDDHERLVTVKDPGVRLEGAWQFVDRDGFTSCEDGNDNKGASHLSLPITVDEPGEYQLGLLYRRGGGEESFGRSGRRRPRPENAKNVLIEVISHDPSRLEQPRDLPKPPPGEARFTIDETLDTIAWWDLKTAFQFTSDEHYVEINNTGTRRQVVADAVRFTRSDGQKGEVIIDDPKAVGHEQWQKFTKFPFRPYNITGGGTLTDDGQKKGELTLRYVPTQTEGWDSKAFWRVGVGFPGQQRNETQVPVVVHAAASSPIARLQAPRHAHVGAEMVLDASASFNLQNTPLKVTWVQVGGPKVALADAHAARVSFEAPVMKPAQAAWEGLARALMKHPDFLFTRPLSLAQVTEPKERARLQLVKLAQDLVGRSPTRDEVARLDAGTALPEMVQTYLDSQEFRDFYFHRVRLYLESQGTEEEDEPVRLWCYVAFHDRPFQEILTADYTVGPDMQKQDRPAYHGRTGILTTRGFIKGKPGLPHFNYAAQVAEKFLGYVFEVPPEIVAAREGITATATTDPSSLCYSCHKVLTPLAFQREAWTDDGEFKPERNGKPVDDSDHSLVDSYPFKGKGMEAFALQAQKKERFIRTMINTHFVFYFGREMRWNTDEREFYRRLWDSAHAENFKIRSLIAAIVLSPEYLDGTAPATDIATLGQRPLPPAHDGDLQP